MVLRDGSGKGVSRPPRHRRICDVWLGHIPVRVWLGNSAWTTSLFPKDGRYLVPIKASVRNAEQLEEGDQVTVHLEVRQ